MTSETSVTSETFEISETSETSVTYETYETLITILTIENLIHYNLCRLTIKSDTGQYSQFLRCFFLFLTRSHHGSFQGFTAPEL